MKWISLLQRFSLYSPQFMLVKVVDSVINDQAPTQK